MNRARLFQEGRDSRHPTLLLLEIDDAIDEIVAAQYEQYYEKVPDPPPEKRRWRTRRGPARGRPRRWAG